MDYLARRRSADAGLAEDRVILTRQELDELHDRLYALEAAVEDAEADLEAARTMADVRAAAAHLMAAAKPLTSSTLLSPR